VDYIRHILVYDYGEFVLIPKEVSMVNWMVIVGGCVMFIAGIVAYAPIAYVRKTNKLIKILEQIEANTRKS
jgi:hypothetical protein